MLFFLIKQCRRSSGEHDFMLGILMAYLIILYENMNTGGVYTGWNFMIPSIPYFRSELTDCSTVSVSYYIMSPKFTKNNIGDYSLQLRLWFG